MVQHSVKGYVPYEFNESTGDIAVVLSSIRQYPKSVDRYQLFYVPVIFTIYLISVPVLRWLLSIIPVVNIIAFPLIILFDNLDNKIVAFLFALLCTTINGFCKGYYYREKLIETQKVQFLPNIWLEFYWQDKLIYCVDKPYYLPHFYVKSKWIICIYDAVVQASSILFAKDDTSSKNIVKRLMENLHKKFV